MEIVIHSMGMPFNGQTVASRSLGGSESAAYYQARELARRGHRVHVFTTSEEQGQWDGVNYLCVGNINQQTPLGRDFEWYARNTPHDVLVIQRHPLAFHGQWASKVNIWQLHDLALFRTAAVANHGAWQIDAVTGVSKWHKDQICEVYGFPADFVQVVPNGVDPTLYVGEDVLTPLGSARDVVTGLIDSKKFLLLYQSRPERGLEHLVHPGGIMDRLADTDAHLLVCGYDNTVPQMAAFYQKLEQQGKALGNVTFVGSLSKPQLAALQRSCDMLCYPTEFEEVSCISVMEAMHARLPILTSAVGALPETLEVVDAGACLVKPKDGVADEGEFVRLINHYASNRDALVAMKDKQAEAAKYKTWERAVQALESVIETAFSRRSGNVASQLRHCIEHSDIAFAERLVEDAMDKGESFTTTISRTVGELEELYAFAREPELFAAHYAEHQTKYYDQFEDKVIGEDVTGSTRFRGVAALVAEEVGKRGGRVRVLDYGCAHGHYLIPLAGAFPDSRFVGMDISMRAIGAAAKWVQKAGLSNVEELVCGDQDGLTRERLCQLVPADHIHQAVDATTGQVVEIGIPHPELDWFDVVIAGEVLEHVMDWRSLFERFRSVLRPGGVIIVTTPLGRWEWTGTDAFREAREHLHHFDKQDIVDICADNPHTIMCAPASHDRAGRALGSWVWRVEPRGEFGSIDFGRKRSFMAPRDTVSACLIVKDAERTLRRCVESFVDWVDEVVVAVDPSTSDRTREVLANLASDYRWKPFVVFDGLEALKDGFAAARNETLARATCEWVMWCDADEEVQQPCNMWKYLRRSMYDAIGFPQVHYSTNPPQVLTTDYPCRLFRRNGKIQFHGVVHEHPEDEVGKGVARSTVRHDVQFLHCGYIDEETRRNRYARNLPLLMRDRKENPGRSLNRFLMLRDIAQGLMFEQEQTGGYVVEGQPQRAEEAIAIYEEMVEKDPVRAIIEALKYYSHCVAVVGRGFEAKISLAFKNDHAPDLSATLDAEGRFHSRAFYSKFITRLHEEATKQYESKYL